MRPYLNSNNFSRGDHRLYAHIHIHYTCSSITHFLYTIPANIPPCIQEGVSCADPALRVSPAGGRHLRHGHRPRLLREGASGPGGQPGRPGTRIPARLPGRPGVLQRGGLHQLQQSTARGRHHWWVYRVITSRGQRPVVFFKIGTFC